MPDTTKNENPQVTAENIRTRIAALLNYARDCERRFYGGEAVDLSGLDQKTAELCDDLLTLPRADGQACMPDLQKLIVKIEDMGKALAADDTSGT